MNEEFIEVILKSENKDPDSTKMWNYWTEQMPVSQIPSRYEAIVIKNDNRSISGYVDYVEKIYENRKLTKVVLTLEWVEVEERE